MYWTLTELSIPAAQADLDRELQDLGASDGGWKVMGPLATSFECQSFKPTSFLGRTTFAATWLINYQAYTRPTS